MKYSNRALCLSDLPVYSFTQWLQILLTVGARIARELLGHTHSRNIQCESACALCFSDITAKLLSVAAASLDKRGQSEATRSIDLTA